MIRRLRIAVLIDNLGPYHVARIAAASRLADMTILEASPTRSEYAWDKPPLPPGIGYVPLDSSGAASAAAIRTLLDQRLTDLRLDAVAAPGWSSLTSLVLIDWARRRDIPAILMSETNGWDFARRKPAELLKRLVIEHFTAALVTSDSQRDYLVELGMPPAAIQRGYNAVDNAFFAARADAVRAAGTVPALAGFPPSAFGRYFLSSARFVEKKNLPGLLAGYAAFRRDRTDDPGDWPLLLLGDGPQRVAVEAARESLGLVRHVHLPGFRQIDDLPAFYGTAGAFVLASTVEQWGLVVNEAMASALPVAVSRRCGCAEVLVEDGVNGALFDPADTADIARVLGRLADADDLRGMGEAARHRVADWGPDRFAAGLDAAARYALAAARRPTGLVAHAALKAATLHRLAMQRGVIRSHRLS